MGAMEAHTAAGEMAIEETGETLIVEITIATEGVDTTTEIEEIILNEEIGDATLEMTIIMVNVGSKLGRTI